VVVVDMVVKAGMVFIMEAMLTVELLMVMLIFLVNLAAAVGMLLHSFPQLVGV
jgi:hypothetical protein